MFLSLFSHQKPTTCLVSIIYCMMYLQIREEDSTLITFLLWFLSMMRLLMYNKDVFKVGL